MNEEIVFWLVVVFGASTFLMVRSREIRGWQAALIFLFGFYTALTPAVYMISGFVSWFIEHFTPVS